MVCPKFNPHVYKLKRLIVGEYICIYFATTGPKRCFHGGSVKRSETIVDGPMNKTHSRKRTNYEHTHEL
jgi:hypothetical protein